LREARCTLHVERCTLHIARSTLHGARGTLLTLHNKEVCDDMDPEEWIMMGGRLCIKVADNIQLVMSLLDEVDLMTIGRSMAGQGCV
jgi:3-phosphoglycerate kinase